jgi:hypothetical protein
MTSPFHATASEPAADAEDLALAAGAEQHRAVAEERGAPHARGLGDRQRAEVEPRPHVAAGVDAHAGEVAALEVVERGELERARPDGVRGQGGGGDGGEAERGEGAARGGARDVHRGIVGGLGEG